MNKVGSQLAGLFKRFSILPEDVPSKHYRYYFVANYAFFIGLMFHLLFILLFSLISVKPLALLNVGSSIIWIFILWLHLKGKMIAGVFGAISEIIVHAALCVVLIGWDTGFQYYLFYMAVMIFFAPFTQNRSKVFITLLVSFVYAGLYFFFREATPTHTLKPWITNILYYGNALSVFLVLALTTYYYNRAATDAESALEQEKTKLEDMTSLLKKMFGRYLSTEVMNSLIENPSALELGGEKRSVTIMMTDLRGFTALSERLAPEQVVQMLNIYFEVMVDIVLKYNGTINEIIGDALLVIFGAPQEMKGRAQRAVACSVEMQNAMANVNEQNRSLGLPELEMGIGLNEAEVIVGNIGTAKRSKYAAVGSGVNMTSRIESYTVGGQILISESVLQEAGEVLRIDAQRDVLPKGSETPLRIYEVGGISGQYNLALDVKDPDFVTLSVKIPLKYTVLEGKDVGKKGLDAYVVKLSKNCAVINIDAQFEPMTNLKMNLADVDELLSVRDFYGKVIKSSGTKGKTQIVYFTSLPPEVNAYFQALRQYGVKPESN
ncbi:adenylate/guanylate cyclase domain-containing protein [Thermodesulfobacteriota bacterium]